MLAGNACQAGIQGRGSGLFDKLAGFADQENHAFIAVMLMVHAGDEGVEQFQPVNQPVLPEEIKRPVGWFIRNLQAASKFGGAK